MLNLSQTFAICKHTKGAWAVWELQKLLTMNRQKATRGSLAEGWHPVEMAASIEAGNRRMSELKAESHQEALPLFERDHMSELVNKIIWTLYRLPADPADPVNKDCMEFQNGYFAGRNTPPREALEVLRKEALRRNVAYGSPDWECYMKWERGFWTGFFTVREAEMRKGPPATAKGWNEDQPSKIGLA